MASNADREIAKLREEVDALKTAVAALTRRAGAAEAKQKAQKPA